MALKTSHSAQGGKSFGMDSKPPAEGDEAQFVGANPNPEAAYDLDPALAPNKFPRESGSDSYSGIPGDGIVPG